MIINYLIVENFKSFKERTFFDLEVKQKEQNIILIEALNGIGKTSFLQAMNIVFFGLGKVTLINISLMAMKEKNDSRS
jgi:DNA sulfur modification protein DndD